MNTLQEANIGEFIKAATVERPGVAVSVARLRVAYEHSVGPIGRSVFLAELGRAGYQLVEVAGTTLDVGRQLIQSA